MCFNRASEDSWDIIARLVTAGQKKGPFEMNMARACRCRALGPFPFRVKVSPTGQWTIVYFKHIITNYIIIILSLLCSLLSRANLPECSRVSCFPDISPDDRVVPSPVTQESFAAIQNIL